MKYPKIIIVLTAAIVIILGAYIIYLKKAPEKISYKTSMKALEEGEYNKLRQIIIPKKSYFTEYLKLSEQSRSLKDIQLKYQFEKEKLLQSFSPISGNPKFDKELLKTGLKESLQQKEVQISNTKLLSSFGPISHMFARKEIEDSIIETVENKQEERVLDEMIYIPAGEFISGPENTAHSVYLKGYYIDKFEVTNKQYKEFVDATGHIEYQRIG